MGLPTPHPHLGPAWRLRSGCFRSSPPCVEADSGSFPREGRFQKGARVMRATCSWWLGRGDLHSFSMAITQLATLSKAFFPLGPVIHRMRRSGQRALKPHPVRIPSRPLAPPPLSERLAPPPKRCPLPEPLAVPGTKHLPYSLSRALGASVFSFFQDRVIHPLCAGYCSGAWGCQ